MPGMYAVTSIWLVRRTRAILRSAEFGFFGVIVRTWRQTPRFWGAPGIDTWRCRRLFQFLRMAGALILEILRLRPWRTSWLIVGTKTLLLSMSVRSDGRWRPAGLGSSSAFRRVTDRSLDGSKMGQRRRRRGRTPPEATKAESSSGPTSVSNVRRAAGSVLGEAHVRP